MADADSRTQEQQQQQVKPHIANKIRFQDPDDTSHEIHQVTCEFTDSNHCTVDLGLLSEAHTYEVKVFLPKCNQCLPFS